MNNTTGNLSVLSADGVISQLSAAYISMIEKGLPLKLLPAFMLWGPPGVGKSQAVKQVAARIGERTGKRVKVTDVRLLLFNPIDLRGIPTANADKSLAVWLKPQIFDMDESPSVVNILFLDEISAAPQSVQAAAYQITLDRVVGEHRLPENCIVIAAGNRVTDKSVAYKMPKALANRLCHIEVESNFESWRRWAVSAGIHEKVLGFLSFRADRLSVYDAGSDDLAFATPRSWEMVSHLLSYANEDVDAIYPLLVGCVGAGVATEFRTWCKVYRTLPSIADIFNGRIPPMPSSPDAMYALVSSMTAYAKEHQNDMNAIANSVRYATKMPTDFSVVLFKNYVAFGAAFKDKLMRLQEVQEYARTKGRYLNGVF